MNAPFAVLGIENGRYLLLSEEFDEIALEESTLMGGLAPRDAMEYDKLLEYP